MKVPWPEGPGAHTRARGAAAEAAAVAWLQAEGYRVVARNVSTVAGEIDVIAWDGDCLCFIEVKARASRHFGPAVAAVDRRKQRRLVRAAALYLLRRRDIGECRFDVLGLDLQAGVWRYSLVRDAFSANY